MANVSIKIEVEGYDEALHAFERYGDHAYNEVKRAGLSAGLGITAKAKLLAPKWLGEMAGGIYFDFPEAGRLEFITEVKSPVEYSEPIEFGARPHMPPVDAIAPWAIAHGIDPWVLAYHIKKHGTEAHPFMRPAFIEEVPDYLRGLIAGLNVAEMP